ncbi:site-specific integrase [Lachnospiraceae bacterium NSJ-143]|nr:site-specific integrase [Lachnospiraceae bacterium NSJ-143]
MIFKTIINEWLSEKINVKISTLSTYSRILDSHILPNFGNLQVEKISSGIICNFINENKKYSAINEGLSNKYLNDIIIILNDICKFMRQKGYICIEIKIPLLQNYHSGIDEDKLWTIDKQEVFEDYCFKHIDRLIMGMLLSLYTGIREGELCALNNGDIDIDKKVIRVTKTMQRIKNMDTSAKNKTKIIIDTPKSQKSTRNLPIPEFLVVPLKRLKNNTENSYFLTGTNQYKEPRVLQYNFKKVLTRCNLEYVNFHMLRHLFAVNMLREGCDMKTLSELLGHSSVEFTMKVYAHSTAELKKMYMAKTYEKYNNKTLLYSV